MFSQHGIQYFLSQLKVSWSPLNSTEPEFSISLQILRPDAIDPILHPNLQLPHCKPFLSIVHPILFVQLHPPSVLCCLDCRKDFSVVLQ